MRKEIGPPGRWGQVIRNIVTRNYHPRFDSRMTLMTFLYGNTGVDPTACAHLIKNAWNMDKGAHDQLFGTAKNMRNGMDMNFYNAQAGKVQSVHTRNVVYKSRDK